MGFTTEDLAAGLSILALAVLVIGMLTAFTIVGSRRRGSTTLALDVTDRLAFAWVCLCAIGVILAAFTSFAAEVILEDPVRQMVLDREPQLEASCEFAGADSLPGLGCGGTIIGAAPGVRVLLFAGALLTIAASAAVGWAIHVAARSAREGAPFRPIVARTFTITGIVVMTAVVVGDIVRRIGMTLAARSLPWREEDQIPFPLEIALWPFAVGIGFFALAAIFRHGARLQRETEGLV